MISHSKLILVFIFLIGSYGYAQYGSTTDTDSLQEKISDLEKRLQILEGQKEKDDLQKIIDDAENLSTTEKSKPKDKVFKTGQRSLQAINPEISLTADGFGQRILNADGYTKNMRSGAFFRVAGLHIQSNLDPYSTAKAVIGFGPASLQLGEVYATWTSLFKNISLTAGKFRQQFGVVNRWHLHGLDQFDFPLAMTTILGNGGLNQIGISFEWLMPSLIAQANTLTFQITNGQNEQLFQGEMFSLPAVLMHFKNYYELNENTYLDLGITGMGGTNNLRGYDDTGTEIREDMQVTWLVGIDLTLMWEPLNQAHYHSFVWRTEFYYAHKELADNHQIDAGGIYSYGEYRFNENFYSGLRLDYTMPFEENNGEKYQYQLVPYLTWWQSHWVRLRLQYNYLDATWMLEPDNMLRLQLTWSIGPHKHERY